MPSIALFSSKFTNESAIIEALSYGLNLSIVSDTDIINDVFSKSLATREKLVQCLYKKTSVFNPHTLERERNVNLLKSAMVSRMLTRKNHLYCGFTSLLIPKNITHVLKVLLVDSKEGRILTARAEDDLSAKEAARLMKISDQSAYDWTDFLYCKEAFDRSLYDIVIPVENMSPDKVAVLIKENFNKTAVLDTEDSFQAVRDFALTVQVEQVLLANGQKIEVETHNGHVSMKVNKSAFSFSRLTKKLTKIAESVDGAAIPGQSRLTA